MLQIPTLVKVQIYYSIDQRRGPPNGLLNELLPGGGMSCENLHSLPNLHRPCAKNLQGGRPLPLCPAELPKPAAFPNPPPVGFCPKGADEPNGDGEELELKAED